MEVETFTVDFEPREENGVKIGILALKGEFTIQNASEIKGKLLENIVKLDKWKINVEGVTLIDLSGVQLLYSAFLFATEKSKQIELEGNCPLIVLNAVKESGFDKVEWLEF